MRSQLMAEPRGFEPPIFCVTGRHVRPLHHGSIIQQQLLFAVTLTTIPYDCAPVKNPPTSLTTLATLIGVVNTY